MVDSDERKGPYYVLVNGTPTPCSWRKWMLALAKGDDRFLAHWYGDKIRVTTIFIGVDYSLGTIVPPLLWETRVFGGPLNDNWERYPNADAALKGHLEWIKKVEAVK